MTYPKRTTEEHLRISEGLDILKEKEKIAKPGKEKLRKLHNNPKGWLHSSVRKILKSTSPFNRLFVKMDPALGYGKQPESSVFLRD